MKPRTPLRVLLLPLFVLAVLAACGDDGATGGEASATPATTPAPNTTQPIATTTTATVATAAAETGTGSEAMAATGRILVSSSAITGHQGQVLLVFGPNNGSEICAPIDSDPWALDNVALTDRNADSDPCTGSADAAVFEPGEYGVTASIFTPGSRTPASSTAAVVAVVDGDAHLQLDGGKLSATTAGEPGRVNVTVSEITGQAGKVLVVIGQNNAGSLCAMIDSDPWALTSPAALRELPGGDGGPCSEDTPEVLFPAGDMRIAAAVVIPGNPSPEATIDVVVTVDGDVSVAIDGERLSR